MGEYIIDKKYKQRKIKIAFHPLDEKFEVQTPVIRRDKAWIEDISEIFTSEKTAYSIISEYIALNPDASQNLVVSSIENLFNLVKKQIGLILGG